LRQQIDLGGLPSQAATRYYQFNHSKVKANPLSALPIDTTSELTCYLHTIPLHYNFLMLNIKQGSYKYQLLKYFGLAARESNPGLPTMRRTI